MSNTVKWEHSTDTWTQRMKRERRLKLRADDRNLAVEDHWEDAFELPCGEFATTFRMGGY